MAIRVLRVLEYTYPDGDAMAHDREHWQVQGVYRVRKGHYISSAVVSTTVVPEPVDEEVLDDRTDRT